MTDTFDPRVDAWIEALPDWQRAICREVRDLVHAAARDEMMRTTADWVA